MTELYWSNVTLLNCWAHANIHIVVIRCIFNCCFHTAVSFCCLFRYWEKSAQYIYIFIQTPLMFGCICSEVLCVLLLICRRAELQSCATAPHWSNRSIAGSYIRSYEIKRLLDNKNICRQFFIVDVVDNVD